MPETRPPSLLSLLARWEDAQLRGEELTPEELCPNDAELAARLRQGIAWANRVDAMVVRVAEPPATLTAAERPPAPPPTIPGYEILEEIGRGGMGVVFKARHVALNRIVALKMVLAGAYASADERSRFLAEAEAAAAVRHPGIVEIHDLGTCDGLPFLAMEFCAGGSLADLLAGTPMPPRASAALVEQLARAVHHAHSKGVIHRDLKPGNILLCRKSPATLGAAPTMAQAGPVDDAPLTIGNCDAKITDFGLAKRAQMDGLTRTGEVIGTPSYMPPEQAEGKKEIGPAVDVYALGAILYECLTGRPPFRAATAMETARQVIHDEPVAVRQLQPTTPRDLETVCLKCLHKEAERRYASASDLADELVRFLAGEPIHARPVGTWERAVKWTRRRPAVAGLLAAVVVLTAASLLTITAMYRDVVRQKDALAAANAGLDRARRRAEVQANLREYAWQLTQARRAAEAADPDRALAVLDGCAESLRGWEHAHLRLLLPHDARLAHDRRKPAATQCVAFSRDGRLVAAGYEDGTIRVWETRAGRLVRTIVGQGRGVWSLHFHPDGRRLAAALDAAEKTGPGQVRLWDARSGELLRELNGHQEAVFSVRFNRAGTQLIGAGGRSVHFWEPRSGKPARPPLPAPGSITSLALSPDESRLACGDKGGVTHVIDLRTGKAVLTLGSEGGMINDVAFNSDGTRLATADLGRRLVQVWDAQTGRPLRQLHGEGGKVVCVAFSPSRRAWLAFGRLSQPGGPAEYVVVESDTGQPVQTISCEQLGSGEGIAFSPDGGRLACCSGRNLRVVGVGKADLGVTLRPELPAALRRVHVPSFRIPLRALAVVRRPGEAGSVEVEDRVSGLRLAGFPAGGRDRVRAPDGSVLAETDGFKVVLRDPNSRGIQHLLPGDHKGAVALAFSPDSRRLAVATPEEITLWETRTGIELLRLVVPEPRDVGAPRDVGFDAQTGCLVLITADWVEFWRTRPGPADQAARELGRLVVAGQQRRWDEAQAALDRLAAGQPDPERFSLHQARILAGRGRVRDAARFYLQAARRSGADAALVRECAEGLFAAGDLVGYREACAALLRRPVGGGELSYQVARVCLLGPGALSDYGAVIRLAGVAAGQPRHPLIAAALMRAGRFDEAIDMLKHSDLADGWAARRQLLLLAYRRAGRHAEADRAEAGWRKDKGGPYRLGWDDWREVLPPSRMGPAVTLVEDEDE